MEKLYRKSAVKVKKANGCMWLLKISYFKRDHKKGNLIFSFAPSPFFGQNYQKQKGLELVTGLFELQKMLAKIPFLVRSLEFRNCGKKRKKNRENIE